MQSLCRRQPHPAIRFAPNRCDHDTRSLLETLRVSSRPHVASTRSLDRPPAPSDLSRAEKRSLDRIDSLHPPLPHPDPAQSQPACQCSPYVCEAPDLQPRSLREWQRKQGGFVAAMRSHARPLPCSPDVRRPPPAPLRSSHLIGPGLSQRSPERCSGHCRSIPTHAGACLPLASRPVPPRPADLLESRSAYTTFRPDLAPTAPRVDPKRLLTKFVRRNSGR